MFNHVVLSSLRFRSMSVVDALLSIRRGDTDGARSLAHDAHEHGNAVGGALASFLAGASGSGVYDEPTAFQGFIDGGGNVALYEAVVEFVSSAHEQHRTNSVLDIGCGDGRVIVASGGSAERIDLVEPSEDLLAEAVAGVASIGRRANAHHATIEAFLIDDQTHDHWDLAQSTFALHNIAPDKRAPVFTQLAARCDRLLLVEFDVPGFDDGSSEHAVYAAQRYERGIAEYVAAPDVIAGFLMPVLVGQFSPTAPRHTYEQPASRWKSELESCGWHVVRSELIDDYWWAPAIGIEAIPAERGSPQH